MEAPPPPPPILRKSVPDEIAHHSSGVNEGFRPIISASAPTSHVAHRLDTLPDLVLACLAEHLWQPDLITASQVCSTWRHCLVGMSSLWTEVGAKPRMRGPPVEQLLRRSSVQPFTFDAIITPANVRSVGLALRNHMARCRGLKLRLYDVASPDVAGDLIAALSTPAPLLRFLTLQDRGEEETLRAHDGWFNGQPLFAGFAPELRKFSLMGNLSAFAGCVSLNRVIDFHYDSRHFNFSSTQLLKQLFPGLQSWTIESPRRPEYLTSFIHLPSHLKEISMSGWETDAKWKASFMALVPHANVPRITIFLSMTSMPSRFTRLLINLSQDIRDITMRIIKIKNLREVVGVDLEWSVDGPGPGNRVRQIRSVPPVAWASDIFSGKVTTLWCPVAVFSLAGSFLPGNEWINLEVLHLLVEDGIPPKSETTTGTVSSETPNIINCPRLQFIHLHGGEQCPRVRRTDVQDFMGRHLDFDRGLVGSLAPHLRQDSTSGEGFQPEIVCVSCELVDDDLVSLNHEGGHEVVEGGTIAAEEPERNPS